MHPSLPAPRPVQTDRLPAFNQQLIDQALALVAAHGTRSQQRYAGPAEAHLRHVIEHYEALFFPAAPGVADYDSRPRDRELESNTALARTRLLALSARLGRTARVFAGQPSGADALSPPLIAPLLSR